MRRLKRLGRYELLEALSRDGDGTVYKARDPLLGRLVAIKTVELDPGSESGHPDFERKVRLAAGLAHPNIVSVYDAAASRDVAYLATELVEGTTLRDTLSSGVALPAAAIERIAAQVADGLDFMHGHGVVHGDVSPSTVVVLDIGFVKITYLGDALFPMGWSMAASSGRAISQYVSPEHVTAAPLDARSDVFSLGVVLYEMLTGIAPFSGNTSDELFEAITRQHPPPPSTLNPNIPSGFDYVVARAMSKDPDHRYPSARDMASHLRKWALEEPTFFAIPRSAAAPVQAALPEVAHIAGWREVVATAQASSVELPPESSERGGILRTRRQWLLYGIPGALLTMSAAWAIWSRPTSSSMPTPGPVTETLASENATSATAPAAQSILVHDESPPTIEQAEDEPVRAAVTEPPPARIEQRPMLARVKLAVSPWGEIYVDGRRWGVSPPLRQIELSPGKHRIEIRNTNFPPRRESVQARANARLQIKHKFA